METRNRSHYGMGVARSCLSQHYNNAILLDPLLLKLRAPDEYPLLISTLIFTRYKHDLSSIPIEGGRSIPEETLRVSEELNRRFPRDNGTAGNRSVLDTSFTFSAMAPYDETLFQVNNAGEPPSMKEELKDAFDSTIVHELFTDYLGDAPENWMDPLFDRRHPDANKYAAVAISKALCDIKLGKDAPKDFAAYLNYCRDYACNHGGEAEPEEVRGLAKQLRKVSAFIKAFRKSNMKPKENDMTKDDNN